MERASTPTLNPALLPHVAPPLRALILRMLAVSPEERGTAEQLAKEMERVACSLPDASASLKSSPQEQASPRVHRNSRRLWLAAGVAVSALAVWTWWMTPPGRSPTSSPTDQP